MPAITDPNEPYFKDGIWGWDGTVWRRLPLVFGLSEPWAETLAEVKVGAGAYNRTSSVVPAGEIWVLQAATYYNNTGARGMIQIQLQGMSQYLALAFIVTPAQYEPAMYHGEVVMSQGDAVNITQQTCLNNDICLAEVRGYKMLIAE